MGFWKKTQKKEDILVEQGSEEQLNKEDSHLESVAEDKRENELLSQDLHQILTEASTPPDGNEPRSRKRVSIKNIMMRFLPIIVTVVLFSPTIIILILRDSNSSNRNILDASQVRQNGTLDSATEGIRWSVFLTTNWIGFMLSYGIVSWFEHLVPFIASFFPQGSEKIQIHLESVETMFVWEVTFMYSLFLVGSIHFLHIDTALMTDTNIERIAWILVCFTALLLVQKMTLHHIGKEDDFFFSLHILTEFSHESAIQFHKKAFEERMNNNIFAFEVLNRLQKNIKRVTPKKPMDKFKEKEPMAEVIHFKTKRASLFSPSSVFFTDKSTEEGIKKKSYEQKADKLAKYIYNGILDHYLQIFKESSPTSDSCSPTTTATSNTLCSSNISSTASSPTLTTKTTEVKQEHFLMIFPQEEKDFAQKAFQIFDRDNNGDLTLEELQASIADVYRERRAIGKSLRDSSSVISTLERIMFTLVVFLTIISGCSIYQSFALSSLLPLGSILLALSFIFGQSARDTFECFIFIFVVHPYDTGDRVYIDDMNVIVKRINLLTTVFQQSNGQELYVNNIVLKMKFIRNIRRSGSMSEGLKLYLDFNTPASKIQELKEALSAFAKENQREYQSLSLNVCDLDNLSRITMNLSIDHKKNWQHGGERSERTAKVLLFIKEKIKELDIAGGNLCQKILLSEVPSTVKGW